MKIIQPIKNHKVLVKNTGYLTAVEVMRMLLPFVALPYVIRTIGGERYGTIAFAQTIISYFVIFINFGMDVSAVKDVSVHRNDKERLNKVVSSVLLLKLLLFLLALYNPQNEMFAHFQTKCIIFKNETQLFKVIPHTPKISKKSTGFAGILYI